MVVKVLGPLETGSASLGPRERTVLAALIVRRTTSMSPPELAEAWWGETLPPTWAQQVRNSVARIRGRLGHDAILTEATDYRLGIDADTIDAVRFERLVSDARGHALRGEHDRAVDGYRKALALWRGEPLQDVADWEPGVVEAMRLGEIRTSAQEELLDERLRTGEHRAVIPEAERLVREAPLREDRWAILALANYRADRQAEALATVRAARERLADELGIEPGARLTALETAMLRRDASIDAPEQAPRPYRSARIPGCARSARRTPSSSSGASRMRMPSSSEHALVRSWPWQVRLAVESPRSSSQEFSRDWPSPGRQSRVVPPTASAAGELRAAGEVAAIVVIDQAEELLALAPETREDIFGALDALRADGRTILLTVRSDALDALRASAFLGDAIGSGVYLLGPLDAASCREVIEEPARRAGLRLEPGLVELAIRDCGDRVSTLPHLSHALRETWHRREGLTLTVAGYEDAGGIAGGIAQSAESVFRSLTPDQQELCRSLMRRLIDRSPDGISTRRRVPLEPIVTDSARRDVLERLVHVRLLTVDGEVVMVTHEAIASAWPRLDGWLDEDAERARVLRIVETAAMEWDAGGRNDEDLLRGARLTGVATWRETSDRDLTDVETGFLDASVANADAEMRELEHRAAHERSRNRVLRGLVVGAAALLVAAIAAGGVAVVQGREAAVSAEDQRIEALVATSLSLRSTDLDVAALLAVEAYQRWPNDGRVRSSLWGVLTSAHGLVSKWRFDGAKVAAAVIPGTSNALLVVQGTGDAETAIVDLDTTETLRTIDVDMPFGDYRQQSPGGRERGRLNRRRADAPAERPRRSRSLLCQPPAIHRPGNGRGAAGIGRGPGAHDVDDPDGAGRIRGVPRQHRDDGPHAGGLAHRGDHRFRSTCPGGSHRRELSHQRDRLGGGGPDRGRGRNGNHSVRRRDPRTPHPPCDPRKPHCLDDDLRRRRRRHVGTRRHRPDRRGVGDRGVDRRVARGWRVLVARTGHCPRHDPVRSERTGHSPLDGNRFSGGTARDAADRRNSRAHVARGRGRASHGRQHDDLPVPRGWIRSREPTHRGREGSHGGFRREWEPHRGGTDDGGMQLWDVERDLPVGAPAQFLRWLSDDLIFRADDSGESISRFDGTSSVDFPPDAARGMGQTSASRRRHPATRHISSAPTPCKGSIR